MSGHRLLVDWPRCAGRGVCHELLPEVIALDDWGYPQVLGEVPDTLLGQAGTAVRLCPQVALRLAT
jgi:ferredoxin